MNNGYARVIPTCALTGEAAGKAAALSAKEGYALACIRENHMEKIRINK